MLKLLFVVESVAAHFLFLNEVLITSYYSIQMHTESLNQDMAGISINYGQFWASLLTAKEKKEKRV